MADNTTPVQPPSISGLVEEIKAHPELLTRILPVGGFYPDINGDMMRVPPSLKDLAGEQYSNPKLSDRLRRLGLVNVNFNEALKYLDGPDGLTSETHLHVVDEKQVHDLIADCDEAISSGNVDNFASYEEGVRDTLMWLFEGGDKPCVGREQ